MIAKDGSVPFKAVRYENAKQAQSRKSPFCAFSLYYKGEFITHELLLGKKFEKILAEKRV